MSIYERIGGAASLNAAIDDLYTRVLDDPVLFPDYAGVDITRLKAHQRALVAVIIGGPDTYRGRPLKEVHQGLGITVEAFSRFVGHLVAVLRNLDIDEDSVLAIRDELTPFESDIVDTW